MKKVVKKAVKKVVEKAIGTKAMPSKAMKSPMKMKKC